MRDKFSGGNRDFGGNRGGPRRPQLVPPVKVGDEMEVKIEAVGEKGDGIAKKNGFVLFVPNAKEGQNVKIKVTKVLRKVGFADIVGEGSAPSADEVSAEDSSEDSDSQSEEPSEESSKNSSEDSDDFGEEDKK